MSQLLENKTFDEIRIGDSVSLSRTLRAEEVETWAAVTGNLNLLQVPDTLAASGGPYGMWAMILFSSLIGNRLPGPGSTSRSAQVRFHRPFVLGVEVTATVTVAEKHEGDAIVLLDCRCVDANGQELATGRVEVVAPKEKILRAVPDLPQVHLHREDRYLELIKMCDGLETIRTAVVHPCSADALEGTIQAAERALIDPVLIGPQAKIQAVAKELGIDISAYRLIATEHSHEAAARGVALARSGEVEALMKGSLHTDELLHAVLHRETGIRTERRLSHCFLLAVPTYGRPIIVTDAAINIYPKLEEKRDICQNAIDLAHVVGIENPRVAILSAVETVTPSIPSTLEAAALCKMADRGQIVGGILDGPLAFDNAVDEEAARAKGIVSPVAGHADILLVPDLEAGNMLAKQLTFMGNAEAAGLVMGARVPIVLTSRADSARTRLASCAVAVLYAHGLRGGGVTQKVPPQ